MLHFSAAEQSFYTQVLDKGAAAHKALSDYHAAALIRSQQPAQQQQQPPQEQEQQQHEGHQNGPQQGQQEEQGQVRTRAAARRASAASRSQGPKLSVLQKAAASELLQLRLACLHPQLTTYWKQLSAELQLEQGGALSMAEILSRMRDASQVKLQAAERDLCMALNALAARLTAAAAAEAAGEAPASGGKGSKRGRAGSEAGGSGRKRAKKGADGGGAEAGVAADGAGPSSPVAAQPPKAAEKTPRRSSTGGGTASGEPDGVDADALRSEALALLESSFRVAEHGIAGYRATGRGGCGEVVDRGAGGSGGADLQLAAPAGGAEGDGEGDEEELPMAIASADASWRAWRFTQVGGLRGCGITSCAPTAHITPSRVEPSATRMALTCTRMGACRWASAAHWPTRMLPWGGGSRRITRPPKPLAVGMTCWRGRWRRWRARGRGSQGCASRLLSVSAS